MGSESKKKAHLSAGLQSSLLTYLLPGVDPGVYAKAAPSPARDTRGPSFLKRYAMCVKVSR